jgi:hypothetical protein
VFNPLRGEQLKGIRKIISTRQYKNSNTKKPNAFVSKANILSSSQSKGIRKSSTELP